MAVGKSSTGKNTSDKPGKTNAGGSAKSTEGGSGTQAIASGQQGKSYSSGLAEARKEQRDLNKARAAQSGSAGKQTEGGQDGQPPGGTATSSKYEPGAVPNKPKSNPATELPKAGFMGPLGAGAYAAATALGIADGNPFDDTKQDGWQRDRSRGAGSFNPNDARGLSADERELVGRPLSAGSADEADDPISKPQAGDLYSDVMLKDRRKPITTLKQMLEAML